MSLFFAGFVTSTLLTTLILGLIEARKGWRVAFEWKPADCWVGVFWKSEHLATGDPGTCPPSPYTRRHVWVCVLPMIPMHFTKDTDGQ
jgi:hypothetical protein